MFENIDIFSDLFLELREILEELVVREIAKMSDEKIKEIRQKYGEKTFKEVKNNAV